MWLVSTSEVD